MAEGQVGDATAAPVTPGSRGSGVFPRDQSFTISNKLREFTALSRRLERHLAEQFELNQTDLAAMEHLSRSGSATPGELAEELGVTSAATTFVVNRLSAMGHVHRSPHPDDGRKTVITPSPASLANIATRMAPLGADLLGYLRELPPEDLGVIEAFLDRATSALRGQLDE